MNVKTILVTTDFSETATKAFAPARTLAEKFGAKVVLAHIEPDRLPPIVVEYAAVGVNDILRDQRKRARERLVQLSAEHFGSEADVDTIVTDGTPHVEIVRLAEQRRADLIVMATHGHGFISHAILGSTTERVVRRAPCPVFVVRDTGQDE
jgi:nucleotide-binding universal stress UspA family protein